MFGFLVNNMNNKTKKFTCINKANNQNKISVSNQKHSHFFHIISVATNNSYNIRNKEWPKSVSMLMFSLKSAQKLLSFLGTSVFVTEQGLYAELYRHRYSTWYQKFLLNPQATGLNFTCHLIILTLRLLISYIYGAPSKARNANVV